MQETVRSAWSRNVDANPKTSDKVKRADRSDLRYETYENVGWQAWRANQNSTWTLGEWPHEAPDRKKEIAEWEWAWEPHKSSKRQKRDEYEVEKGWWSECEGWWSAREDVHEGRQQQAHLVGRKSVAGQITNSEKELKTNGGVRKRHGRSTGR